MKKSSLFVVLSSLLLAGVGCGSYPLYLEFNGRLVEVQEMKQASLPRGLEVTFFDGRLMKVNGREAINVNGKPLTVNDSNVSHGTSRHVLGPQHKLVIQKDGKVTIVESKGPPKQGSWWAFWR